MAIYEDKRNGKTTGKYVVEVNTGNRIVKRRVSSMKEAKLLEARLRAGIEETLVKAADRYTLGKLVADCSELWRGTKDAERSYVRLQRVVEGLGPEKVLTSLSALDIDAWHKKLRKQGLCDATINRYNAALTRALKFAQQRDLITKLPHIDWYQEPLKKFSWLQPEDEKRLLEWMTTEGNVRGGKGGSTRDDLGQRVALVVRCLVVTGMRVGELIGAKPEHIDPAAETVTLWDTKTNTPRTQYLPREYAEKLLALKQAGRCPSYSSIQGVLYRAKEALGLDPGLTIHGLRHTTATRLVLAGVNHKVVMDYMGHKSIATTNRYAHVNAEAKKTAAKVLIGGL
jgi:integrase